MKFELLVGLFAFIASMAWLGMKGRWKLALPVSSLPLLLLVWIFASTDQPAGVSNQFAVLLALVLGATFPAGWMSFGFGFWLSRAVRRQASNEVRSS